MAGRPTKKRTCAPPVSFRAMPENEIPPAMRVDIYLLPKRRLQLNDRLNGICLCDDLFFRRASQATPPGMGAGTEKRHSDRPAENNRRYAAERVSHTVASRETVRTVSRNKKHGVSS